MVLTLVAIVGSLYNTIRAYTIVLLSKNKRYSIPPA